MLTVTTQSNAPINLRKKPENLSFTGSIVLPDEQAWVDWASKVNSRKTPEITEKLELMAGQVGENTLPTDELRVRLQGDNLVLKLFDTTANYIFREKSINVVMSTIDEINKAMLDFWSEVVENRLPIIRARNYETKAAEARTNAALASKDTLYNRTISAKLKLPEEQAWVDWASNVNARKTPVIAEKLGLMADRVDENTLPTDELRVRLQGDNLVLRLFDTKANYIFREKSINVTSSPIDEISKEMTDFWSDVVDKRLPIIRARNEESKAAEARKTAAEASRSKLYKKTSS